MRKFLIPDLAIGYNVVSDFFFTKKYGILISDFGWLDSDVLVYSLDWGRSGILVLIFCIVGSKFSHLMFDQLD